MKTAKVILSIKKVGKTTVLITDRSACTGIQLSAESLLQMTPATALPIRPGVTRSEAVAQLTLHDGATQL